MNRLVDVSASVHVGYVNGGFLMLARCVCGAEVGLNISDDPRVMPCCGRKLVYRQEAPKVFAVTEE